METRELKISFNKSGGTASKNGITARITLPIKWIKEMGIDINNREVKVEFTGNKIIINK